jgi:hypothetical protein
VRQFERGLVLHHRVYVDGLLHEQVEVGGAAHKVGDVVDLRLVEPLILTSLQLDD